MEEKALTLIEESYLNFLGGKSSSDKLCKNLGVALSALPFENGRKEFTVQIVKNRDSRSFFGMHIFPSLDDSTALCENLVNGKESQVVKFSEITKRWRTIGKWILELDSLLFDRNSYNFNPKELTAMTLHEVGHVIYSDKPLERFYRSYKEASLRLKLADKATQKIMYQIYLIPLSVACMQRGWVNGRNELNVELVADKTVAQYGYGESLVEAFDKIIRRNGSINVPEAQQDAEIDTSVQWCNNNIQDVIKRKDTLKDELYYRALRSNSNYVKATVIAILDNLGIKLRERYKGIATENSIELLSDPKLLDKYEPFVDAMEFMKFNRRLEALQNSSSIALEGNMVVDRRKKIKVELPSQFEIDSISVEVDNITNHHDRIYVLDLIYEILDRINTFEEVISSDPLLVKKWKSRIDSMRQELDMYRRATLNKRTFSSGYKLFVKLPPQAADYEG